jgi:DNA-binding helix-hairpin-helix protein with protein kinase domain
MPLQLATESQVLTCSSTNRSITLVKQLATSGEGEVWRTNVAGYLAKLYHNLDLERIRKLEVMIANPPQDPNAQIKHTSFAWPKSLLKDRNGQAIGFLMPQIVDSVEIIDVYNPRRRQAVVPGFNWLYLYATAVNVASIISAIHRAGYVLGDIKPQNILVNNQALAAIIDTDSFQVKDPETKAIYRCPVGSEGFTPPELLGQDLAATDQTEIQDRFRLGVIIYLLLFGDHPFKGKWVGKGDSPEPHELLRQGFWPYGVNSLIQPGPLTIPLETVHPELQKCFQRCFTDGHAHPELRPSAQKWFSTLQLAMKELKVCRKNPRHYYSESYGKCHWCDRQRQLGVDIFPKELNWLENKSKTLSNRFKRTVKKTNVKAAKLQKRPVKLGQLRAKTPISLPKLSQIPTIQLNTKISPQFNWFKFPALPEKTVLDRKLLVWSLASIFALSGLIIALINIVDEGEMSDRQWGSTMFAIAIGLGLLGMAGLLLKWTKSENI